jgi:hypothetical protein
MTTTVKKQILDEDVAQVVESLPTKNKALNSNPRTEGVGLGSKRERSFSGDIKVHNISFHVSYMSE